MTRRLRAAASGAAAAAAVLLGAVVLGACTSPRNALGTQSSRCFQALPAARAAVHDKGRFVGVRYLSASALLRALRAHHPELVDVPRRLAAYRDGVCVVGYTGHYEADDLVRGSDAIAETGPLAVVVVRPDNHRVLASFVLVHPPIGLSRETPLSR